MPPLADIPRPGISGNQEDLPRAIFDNEVLPTIRISSNENTKQSLKVYTSLMI
jgi:hypothetical protein